MIIINLIPPQHQSVMMYLKVVVTYIAEQCICLTLYDTIYEIPQRPLKPTSHLSGSNTRIHKTPSSAHVKYPIVIRFLLLSSQ